MPSACRAQLWEFRTHIACKAGPSQHSSHRTENFALAVDGITCDPYRAGLLEAGSVTASLSLIWVLLDEGGGDHL